MSQVKLNKTALSLEQKNLNNYKKFLPSLDLKRQKILIEKNKAALSYKNTKQNFEDLQSRMRGTYPMVSSNKINLKDVINIEKLEITNEYCAGVLIPVLHQVSFQIKNYDYFNTPQWLDALLRDLKHSLETELQLKILRKKADLLNKALRTITQRKNLFEKILIPRSTARIKTIRLFLSDHERAAVVCSKTAKKKRQLQ